MMQIKREIANMWEYIVGNDANIGSFVFSWKARFAVQLLTGIE